MRAGLIALLLLVCPVFHAAAQVRPGDFVLSWTGNEFGLGVVDAVTGRLLSRHKSTMRISHILLAPDNETVFASAIDTTISPDRAMVLRFDPRSGTLATHATIPALRWYARCAGLFLDQDGSLIFVNGGDDFISHPADFWRVEQGSAVHVTSLERLAVHAAALDTDTGDWIAEAEYDYNKSVFLRLTSHGVVTLFPGGEPSATLIHDQTTGHFWRYRYCMELVDRVSGATLTSLEMATGTAMALDQVSGDVFVGENGYYRKNYITRVTHQDRVVQIWGPIPAYDLTGLVVLGSRPLVGQGPATPGSIYHRFLSLPRSPRAPYVAALSLGGLRPGPPLPSGALHIVPDALFWFTLGRDIPGATCGLAGILDGDGRTPLSLAIPAALPRGTTITVAAVAINLACPFLLDWGPSWTVTVR